MRTFLLTALATLAAVTIGFAAEPIATPDFVRKAAQFSLYEVQAGQIATGKGQSEAVKQFGRDIVAAHSKAAGEFKGIVQAEKLEVKMPGKPSKKQREAIEALNTAAPADFDKTYADQQIKAHERAVKLFESYAELGDNPALKQFAANTLSLIKQHLEQAKKLMP
jgi:putative membrane protein